MKHMLKRASSVCTALLCAALLVVSGAVMVMAEDSTATTLEEYLTTTVESLTNTIIPLSDAEIESYMSAGDDFTTSAMTSWSSAKDDLGDLVELKDAEIEYGDDTYTVTLPAEFEKADAEFVYVFDTTGVPTTLSVNVDYPLSVTLKQAGLNTLMGIGTVFIMLIFLSFIISLFRYIPNPETAKKNNQAPAPAPVPVAAVPAEEELADDTELVAVIAAAIAASEGTSPDGFVVRSIRKVNRKKW